MAKHRLTTAILVLVFFVGLGLLLYPPLSNWYNVHHSSRIISSYLDQVADLDDERYAQLMLDAQAFNKKVNALHEYALSPEMMEEYNSVLDVSGLGIMGYVDIPKLNASIPIYHGTSEGVLQIAVGHLEWSSLPIGGESTHCVLSGHRGLPNAKLLTDLPEMEKGDLFYPLRHQYPPPAGAGPQDRQRRGYPRHHGFGGRGADRVPDRSALHCAACFAFPAGDPAGQRQKKVR